MLGEAWGLSGNRKIVAEPESQLGELVKKLRRFTRQL